MIPHLAWANIFENPKNLKVLDESITPAELRQTMRMFSQSLGVRCQHCHVGEEGKPLTEFDFASDDKAAKMKARFMYQMVKDLNQHMITGVKDRSIEVECMTCHRGTNMPYQTVDLLKKTFDEAGLEPALAHHDELKTQYYGSHSHDFTENTLLDLAASIRIANPEASLKMLHKNLTLHPQSVQTLFQLGESYAAQKANQKALNYYEQALKLQPNPWLQQKINALKKESFK